MTPATYRTDCPAEVVEAFVEGTDVEGWDETMVSLTAAADVGVFFRATCVPYRDASDGVLVVLRASLEPWGGGFDLTITAPALSHDVTDGVLSDAVQLATMSLLLDRAEAHPYPPLPAAARPGPVDDEEALDDGDEPHPHLHLVQPSPDGIA